MNTRDKLWARVYADTLQRKSHIEAEEVANFAVSAFDRRRAALASKPPAGEQKPVGQIVDPGNERDMPRVKWFARVDRGAHLYTAPHPEPVAPPAREVLSKDKQIGAVIANHFDTLSVDEYNRIHRAIRDALSATPPAQAVQDSLQGAADWLLKAMEDCAEADLQQRLLIGYNRANRLLNAARTRGNGVEPS